MTSTESDPLIVAIPGSLNDQSVTRLALRDALDSAADQGARTELIDLRSYDLPMVDPNADPPADAARLTEKIAAADALILGTPMYNGTIAAPLKTAIDHADPEEFSELPVALLTVAGGQYPMRALDHLRVMASHLDARVLPHEVAIPESYRIDETLPEEVAERVDELGARIVAETADRPAAACRQAPPADD
jgi:NAD(P)H-dependent FMN reductase